MPKQEKPSKPQKHEGKVLFIESPENVAHKPICPLSGSRHDVVISVLGHQIAGSVWSHHSDTNDEILKKVDASVVQVMGVRPQDEIEGMLAAQMVASHNAAMECYRRAMLRDQTFEGRDHNLKYAAKLSRTYASMIEALSRYRGKGQQKVTVER